MSSLGFKYYRADGRLIRQAAELKRIARLVIPPAWTDVWICADARGHIQATGRDARGRKQYRYHVDWRRVRDETKYERLPAFAAALPRIRMRTSADLARTGLPREKVLAAVVQLLEKSLIRVGNEEYAKDNRSFGLTTFRDRHVRVRGHHVNFEFHGKSGKRHSIRISDRRLAQIVKHCRDLPGQVLFQYVDDDGRRCQIGSGDVNAYLREISAQDFTAKDFRTWFGTVLACTAFREMAATPARSGRHTARQVVEAIDAVAGVLGNTRAVCRKSYIHPRIVEAYTDGTIARAAGRQVTRRGRLSADEMATLAILRAAAAPKSAARAA
jgi:DNA topoisomerase-1